MYISFSLDFGPYNMAQLYRFCNTVELLRGLVRFPLPRIPSPGLLVRFFDSLFPSPLQREHGFMTCFFSSANAQDRANAAVLMGSYMVLYGGMTAPQVMEHFERAKMGPFMPFRDAGALVSTYHLQVADVLAGMERANGLGFACPSAPAPLPTMHSLLLSSLGAIGGSRSIHLIWRIMSCTSSPSLATGIGLCQTSFSHLPVRRRSSRPVRSRVA